MLGVPFVLRRAGDGEPYQETIYLSTRLGSNDQARADGRKNLREYARVRMELGKLSSSAAIAVQRAEKTTSVDTLQEIDVEISAIMDRITKAQADMADLAERIVRRSLKVNYPDAQVDLLVDLMTDAERAAAVEAVLSGQAPADFTPSPVTPPKSSTTSPGGPSQPEDCDVRVLPRRTSTPVE
jgi:hypothetical protein